MYDQDDLPQLVFAIVRMIVECSIIFPFEYHYTKIWRDISYCALCLMYYIITNEIQSIHYPRKFNRLWTDDKSRV